MGNRGAGPRKRNTAAMTVEVAPELMAALEEMARQEEVSRGAVIRRLLRLGYDMERRLRPAPISISPAGGD